VILHEFPDLTWLKSQITHGFSNRLGWGNLPLDTEGFPSVIIHAKVRECYRPDIKGPFSFFLNIRGNSLCSVDRQTTRIDEENYFVSNRSQLYTLQVEENSGGAETFNIHFGEFFSESVLNSLVTPADRILDLGTEKQLSPFSFFNQLHRRDATFNTLIRAILTSYKEKEHNKLRLEEQMTSLLSYHLQQHRNIADIVNNLPPVRKATRIELYKRTGRVRVKPGELFTDLSWFYVFEGMGIRPDRHDPLMDVVSMAQLRDILSSLAQSTANAARPAPSHDSYFAAGADAR